MNSIRSRIALPLLSMLPVLMQAQSAARRDPVPLRHWAAPLYWQPTQREAEAMVERPEAFTVQLTPTVETSPLTFGAMTPCRIADTRGGQGFSGNFGPPSLAGSAIRTLPLPSSSACPVPSSALAYSFNVTVVPHGTLNFLTLFPTGQPLPNASTLNSPQGQITSNAAIVSAGNGGAIDVFATDPTDVILDINGYYIALGPAAANTNTAFGYQALLNNTSGTGNTALGSSALRFDTASSNTAFGSEALGINTSGDANTATGSGAMAANTTGADNTATGASALFLNTSGSANTVTGVGSMSGNTTGNNNTATGFESLAFNTNGNGNTVDGYQAMQWNSNGASNTADGYQALQQNTNGTQNLASGSQALWFNTTGYNNTALGAQALIVNSTGYNNIGIGFGAATRVGSTNSNNIHIGSQGSISDTGTIRIGTPGAQTAFFAAGVRGAQTGNYDALPVLVDSNGQLGTVSSSRRFKEDIQDMGDASSGLLKLRPVTFRYRQPFTDGSKPVQYGLVAEEVAEVYPDLVAHSADGQIESVKYQVLDSMLLNEVQRQQTRIRGLEQQLQEQQERMAKLEAALAAMAAAPAER